MNSITWPWLLQFAKFGIVLLFLLPSLVTICNTALILLQNKALGTYMKLTDAKIWISKTVSLYHVGFLQIGSQFTFHQDTCSIERIQMNLEDRSFSLNIRAGKVEICHHENLKNYIPREFVHIQYVPYSRE